jgi:predicted nicotinamide N-methyase
MKTTRTIRQDRRKFLLAAGAGTAVVGAAAVVKGNAPQKHAEAPPEAAQATGYQASAHVLKYYKTTEV